MNWTTTEHESYDSVPGSLTELMLYTIIGGYALTSLLLLRFPYLIHKRKQIHFKANKISHRGGSAEGIENTVGCYENAVHLGTEMIEMDCQLTSDGEVVVVHDLNLANLCDVPVHVKDTKFKDLPLYKNRLSVYFERDHVIEAGPTTDRKIPLLREVFEKLPGVPMNIDIKIHNDQLIEKVSALVKEFNRQEITVLGSFSSEVSRKVQTLNPEVLHFCSFNKVLKIVLSFYLGILPFLSINESFFEIMMPSIGYDKHNALPLKTTGKMFLRMIDFILMNRFLFRHLQRRGIRVYVWVLNHEDQFDRALAYGVDGIMTDFPSKLTNYMNLRHARSNAPVNFDPQPLCERGA